MAIEYFEGNLLDSKENYIIHGCNCHGVMGGGVALAIKNKWPEVYKHYINFIESYGNSAILLGKYDEVRINDNQFVVNAFTQLNYGGTSRQVSYDAVDKIFEEMAKKPTSLSFAIPQIGAGLANGNWDVISAIINHRMKNHKIKCYIIR